jgi:hypothetical protein
MSSIGGYSLISSTLPPGIRIWISVQAQRLSHARRFGAAEHEQLKLMVKTHFPTLMSQGPAAGLACQYLVNAILS